jgi:hypothetical protein
VTETPRCKCCKTLRKPGGYQGFLRILHSGPIRDGGPDLITYVCLRCDRGEPTA